MRIIYKETLFEAYSNMCVTNRVLVNSCEANMPLQNPKP